MIGAARWAERLLPFERRWAEALFAAILGDGDGLPPFDTIDRTVFWRALAAAPAPSFRVGLRAMVWALTLLPIVAGRWRPFVALPREARLRAVAEWERSPSYAVRQMLAALKMLACFAYFDDPVVRHAVERGEPGVPTEPR